MSGPIWVDEAARVVSRLRPPGGAAVIPFRPLTAGLPSQVRLYDVRWPPPGPGRDRFRGAAVLDDPPAGAVLDLGEATDLGRLAARLWDRDPTLVAEIVARYHRRGPFDVLLTGTDDTDGALPPGLAADLGCQAPRRTRTTEGRSSIAFCTFRLAPTGPDGEIRAAVDRWTVALTATGTVTIRTEELAAQLPSPRYAVR